MIMIKFLKNLVCNKNLDFVENGKDLVDVRMKNTKHSWKQIVTKLAKYVQVQQGSK